MTGWRNYVCDVWMGLAFCVPAARKLWECRAMAGQSEGAEDLIKARPAGAAYYSSAHHYWCTPTRVESYRGEFQDLRIFYGAIGWFTCLQILGPLN